MNPSQVREPKLSMDGMEWNGVPFFVEINRNLWQTVPDEEEGR